MNPRLLIFSLGIFLSSLACAQNPPGPSAPNIAAPSVVGTTIPVWPDGKMPGKGADKPETSYPPQPLPGRSRQISFVSQPTLEVFKATNVQGPAPAMIVCPGGGYGQIPYDREGTQIGTWLNTLGITAFVLKYRVPNNKDGAFQDLQRAVRLVRSHAADWGVQPGKLGVIGFSAGGHLTARLSGNFDKDSYPGIDPVDKLSSRPDFAILVYPAFLAYQGKLSPEITIRPDMPQTLIVHNDDDSFWIGGSKIYDAALSAANVPHQFLDYKTGGRGYGLDSSKEAKVWPTQAIEWLHKIGIL